MQGRWIDADREGLADLLEPETPRVPANDFAFADTVHLRDFGDEERPPPSGPVIVNDPRAGSQWLMPAAFPVPAADDPDATQLGLLASRVRRTVRSTVREARDAWDETLDTLDAEGVPTARDGVDRAAVTMRRLRAFWASWEWAPGDLARGAVIGLAVFVLAASAGAFALAR